MSHRHILNEVEMDQSLNPTSIAVCLYLDFFPFSFHYFNILFQHVLLSGVVMKPFLTDSVLCSFYCICETFQLVFHSPTKFFQTCYFSLIFSDFYSQIFLSINGCSFCLFHSFFEFFKLALHFLPRVLIRETI